MSRPANEVPSQSEYGLMIAWMSQNGMTAQAARDVIGDGPNGRTRKQIADDLRDWIISNPRP